MIQFTKEDITQSTINHKLLFFLSNKINKNSVVANLKGREKNSRKVIFVTQCDAHKS